jgi:hypothetical protein
VFTVVLICFHIAESVLVGVWHGNTLADSLPPLVGSGLKSVLAVGVMCFVVLIPFFGFREIVRVIGHREMRALMFAGIENDPKLTGLGRL